MTNTHSLKGYNIPFDITLPTRSDLLRKDITVVKASKLSELESLLLSDPDEYVNRVIQEHRNLVSCGNLTAQEMQRVVESARQRANSYWKDGATDISVRILPATDMREAAMDYRETLYRKLGSLSPIKEREHAPYLSSFIDHVRRELILSEEYAPDDLSGLGKETEQLLPWNEEILKAVVTLDMGIHVIRSLRGETGDGYLEMLRNVPGNLADEILKIVRNASLYALQEGLQDGGVPVLYMRLSNIFIEPENRASYFPMQVFADTFGIKKVCLWDIIDFEQTPSGVAILGCLTTRHPNYQKKHSGLLEVVHPYGYEISRTFPEPLLNQPSR